MEDLGNTLRTLGEFNAPFGRYALFNTSLVTPYHNKLLSNTEIYNTDYKQIFKMAEEDDFMFYIPRTIVSFPIMETRNIKRGLITTVTWRYLKTSKVLNVRHYSKWEELPLRNSYMEI